MPQEFQPFPAKFRSIETRLNDGKPKIQIRSLLPSAIAISSINANRPASTIHHQSLCCKMPRKLTFTGATVGTDRLAPAAVLSRHTLIASGESAYASSDSLGEGLTLKIFS